MAANTNTPALKILPIDLVDQIFIHYCKPCHEHSYKCQEGPECRRFSPFLLTAVCKEWKNIAEGLPAIWRWIRVSVSSRGSPEADGLYLRLLEKWLQRATDGLLSIDINGWERKRIPDKTLPVQIFELLIKYSKQWRFLSIDSPQANECWRLLWNARGQTPLLELASVDFGRDHIEPDWKNHSFATFFEEAPNLRRLRVKNVESIVSRSQTTVPGLVV